MALTATKVKNAEIKEKPYKLSDEKGMYLLVSTTGTQSLQQTFKPAEPSLWPLKPTESH